MEDARYLCPLSGIRGALTVDPSASRPGGFCILGNLRCGYSQGYSGTFRSRARINDEPRKEN
jgi:hypothetical protein